MERGAFRMRRDQPDPRKSSKRSLTAKAAFLLAVVLLIVWNFGDYFGSGPQKDVAQALLTAGLLALVAIFLFVGIPKGIWPEGKVSGIVKGIGEWFLMPALTFCLIRILVLEENIFSSIWSTVLPLLLFLLLYYAGTILSKRFLVGYLVSAVLFFAAAIINSSKLGTRGEAFMPADLFSAEESTGFLDLGIARFVITPGVIEFFLFFVLGILFFAYVPKIRIRLRGQILAAAVLVPAVALSFPYLYQNVVFLEFGCGVKNMASSPEENLAANGYYLSFLMNTGILRYEAPGAYSEQNVLRISKGLEAKTASTEGNLPEDLPDNIVFVMNESFFDVRKLNSALSSLDVMPFTDSLMQRTLSGSLVAPTVGGGTCNTEFEVLTGFSMSFMPPGTYPYRQYVDRDTDSLARVLHSLGYTAIALHPYDGTLWNREAVYDYFGFSEFLTEDDFDGSGMKRGFYTDRTAYDKILEKIDGAEEPVFCYTVTIQNHLPYELEAGDVLYSDDSGKALSDSVSSYLNRIAQSDRDLEYFVSELEKRREDTLLVFFGDHAPIHGGYFALEIDSDDPLAQYSTPLLVYRTGGETDGGAGTLRISSNYLGSYILDMLDIHADPWFSFVGGVRESFPVLSVGGLVDDRGIFRKTAGPEDVLRDYEVLQYDMLKGSAFFEKEW